MKSLTESIKNVKERRTPYQIDQNDLKKVEKVLNDKKIWKELSKLYNLSEEITELYCTSRLEMLSDPEWYENFEGVRDLNMAYAISELADTDDEDFQIELDDENISGWEWQDISNLVTDVMNRCLKALK